MSKKIQFGTGGFRGVIGDDFNKENIQLVAQALSNIILEFRSGVIITSISKQLILITQKISNCPSIELYELLTGRH